MRKEYVYSPWTEGEIDMLKCCIKDRMSLSEISKMFPYRSLASIRGKIDGEGLNLKYSDASVNDIKKFIDRLNSNLSEDTKKGKLELKKCASGYGIIQYIDETDYVVFAWEDSKAKCYQVLKEYEVAQNETSNSRK